MDTITSRESFLRDQFKKYYLMHTLPEVRALQRRELAVIPFGGKMTRHMGVKSHTALMEQLRRSAPAHVYHSAAMYANPAARAMEDKERIGTDLVFDLDADHIPGAALWTYERQLDRVKQQTIRLLEALEVDFGVSHQDLEVVFSGRRGYHVRALNKAHLSSTARREIAAAFTGAGLTLSGELTPLVVEKETLLRLPPAGGWAARARRNLEGFLQVLDGMGDTARIGALRTIPGIGEKGAKLIKSSNYSPGGIWTSSTAETRAWKALWKYAWESARVDIDAPVTADVHRLIRCPDSLHGKTGLRAALLPPGALEYFDPLKDAVVFDDIPVTVITDHDVEFSLRSERFQMRSGDEAELPMFAAVFALAGSTTPPWG